MDEINKYDSELDQEEFPYIKKKRSLALNIIKEMEEEEIKSICSESHKPSSSFSY